MRFREDSKRREVDKREIPALKTKEKRIWKEKEGKMGEGEGQVTDERGERNDKKKKNT